MAVEINYKVYGSGEPVIVMHGLFGMLDNWKSIARMLESKYMMVLVDLRNHGKSGKSDVHNYEVMAEDIAAFIDQNFLFDAHILGHSMGGKVGMKLALEYEDKIQSLIVVDILPRAYPGGHEHILSYLLDAPVHYWKDRAEATEYLSSRLSDHSIVQFLLKNLKRNKQGPGFEWKFNLDALHNNYNQILTSVESNHCYIGPVSFIKGEKSKYITNEGMEEAKELFPHARLLEIEHAGHWVHADKPDKIEEAILQHLKRIKE